jgi:TolB-like protein/Flp pilus assembly protein TadD
MPLRSSTPELGKDSDQKAAAQLQRILASKAFRQADRLKRFLTFIVEETLAGRGERLKEFVVGVEVFGKDELFDPRNDPIVRVQARRLRSQLARYYHDEGPDDGLVIELPKGGYAPVFRPRKSVAARRPFSPVLVSRNTVVALPFTDDSPSGGQDYFCRGVTQEIIHALARVDGIRLVAWNNEDVADLPEVAHRSKAALIVTGNVRPSGARFRITANLIDAASGFYIWSDAIDRPLDDAIVVQEEVARMVADHLKPELAGAAHAGAARGPAENLAAYNLYVQGRYHLNQRTEDGLRKAVDFFEKAITESAQYAVAYSGLADAYSLLGHYGVLAPAEVWTKAASNATSAVLQDDASAEAHTSLAHVKSTQDWDWPGAEREFQKAITLDSRYPTARHWYAVSCLAPLGRLEEACEQMTAAQALDPISSIIARDLARVHYYKHEYDAALDACDHTIELNPHFSPAYWMLGLVQEQRGEFDESAAAFQRAIQLSPQSPMMQAALGRTLALSGKPAEAVRILQDLQGLAARRYVSPFDLAALEFALQRLDEGFRWLAKAFQDRSFELISLRVDPRWECLRLNPRFEELCGQLNLP